MEYQKAVAVLKDLLEKHPLTEEEKEAVVKAIGMLTLVYQSMSRVNDVKAKRQKATEW